MQAFDSIPEISTELEKVRNSVESSNKCPTVLLKAGTGDNVNLINSWTMTLFSRTEQYCNPAH